VEPSWLSVETFAGLVLGLAFAGLCYVDLRRAILVFTAAGCVRGIQVGAFSGQEVTQGLLLVELFATILIATWFVRHFLARRDRVRRTPFDRPLLLIIPASIVSLAVGFTWFDPTIPLQNMKLSVSLGQILLLVWPIGIYFVVAHTIRDDAAIDSICRIIVLLAVPSLLLLMAPARYMPYLEWSTTFALPASSLSLAAFFHVRSLPRRAGLLVLAFAPALYGFAMGKAFYYAYVLVSSGVIAWLHAPRLVLAGAPMVFAAYVLLVPVATSSLAPGFVSRMIETEESQKSLGGDGGRERLMSDGLTIWLRHPVFGVGPGNNYPYMLRYSTLATPHNQYVNLLLELGALGFLCFVFFAYRAARMGFVVWRITRQPGRRMVALAWLGVFAGMLAGGFFGDFLLPSIRNSGLELLSLFYVQWILLGVMVSIGKLERGLNVAM
jgi:hypothetical protein